MEPAAVDEFEGFGAMKLLTMASHNRLKVNEEFGIRGWEWHPFKGLLKGLQSTDMSLYEGVEVLST